MRNAALLHELGRGLPQVVTEIEGLERHRAGQGQRRNHGIRPCLVEEWDRITFLPRTQHAVHGGADRTGTPELEHLAEVDRERAFLGRHVDPTAIQVLRLQAANTVLRQQCHESGVNVAAPEHVAGRAIVGGPDVGRGNTFERRRRAHRVVQQPQGGDSAVECGVKAVLRQAQPARHRAHQLERQPRHRQVVVARDFAPSGQHVLRGERCRLAQGVAAVDHARPIGHVRTHVDALLVGHQPGLQREPAAVDVGPRGVEVPAPKLANLGFRQAKQRQQLAPLPSIKDGPLRQAGHDHHAVLSRRSVDGTVHTVPFHGVGAEQRTDVDPGNTMLVHAALLGLVPVYESFADARQAVFANGGDVDTCDGRISGCTSALFAP